MAVVAWRKPPDRRAAGL